MEEGTLYLGLVWPLLFGSPSRLPWREALLPVQAGRAAPFCAARFVPLMANPMGDCLEDEEGTASELGDPFSHVVKATL